jgi:predicted lipoprotein with Yx(FWY)xxD motif
VAARLETAGQSRNHLVVSGRGPRALERIAAAGTACLIAASLLGACSSSATSTTSGSPSASSASTSASSHAPSYEVTTRTVGNLGTVLANGQGYTLYLFAPDNQSGHSTCTGACATAWPPLVLPKGVTVAMAGTGARFSLLGTTTRADGTVQVTYNKWPLYRYAIDTSPGQANGQGIYNLGGYWYVLDANGQPVQQSP